MPQSAPPPVYPPIANNRGTVQFQFQGCTNGVHCPPPPPIEEQPLPPPIYGSQVQFVIECSGVVGCPEPCDHMDEGGAAVTPSDVVNGVPTRIYFAPIIPPRLLDTKPPAGTQINVPPAHNLGANEGRLQKALRDAAAAALPLQSLTQAAFKFATGDADDAVWGNAFADLSVTGHRAFANFRQTLPGEWFCELLIGQRPPPLTADQILAGWQPPPPMTNDQVLAGCEKALDRAYRVANFLRTGERGDTPALKTAKTAEEECAGLDRSLGRGRLASPTGERSVERFSAVRSARRPRRCTAGHGAAARTRANPLHDCSITDARKKSRRHQHGPSNLGLRRQSRLQARLALERNRQPENE